MKITVLSGSPKGKLSVSLQSLNYIKKYFQDHDYTVFHIAQTIKKLENDRDEMAEVISSVEKADLVLWVCPVYVYTIPSQFKRFIELIFENDAADSFSGKYTGVITTSINFFDNCAHEYMRGICDDLEMKFAGSFSADSYDLLDDEERKKLLSFADVMFESIQDNSFFARAFPKVIDNKHSFEVITPFTESDKSRIDNSGINMLLVQDRAYSGKSLGNMIDQFRNYFVNPPELVTLNDIDIKGGCTGCVQCGFDHKCIYDGKDDFISFFNEKIVKADVLIFAGETRDRFISAKWKEFFDRSFFNNHTPTLTNRQLGFLTQGPYTQLSTLKSILEAFIEWQGANFAGFVSDEEPDNEMTAKLLKALGERLVRYHRKDYVKPSTFLGIGGRKIFRDDVWGRHRFVFQSDHEYYQKNNFYDFPQYDEAAIKTNENMMKMTENPEMREAIRKVLKSEMVKPHLKVIEEK